MNLNCNYNWYKAEQHFNTHHSLSNFLLFHGPMIQNYQWIPGAFESLQPYRQDMQAWSSDIHRFFVRLGTTTLAEETSSPDETLGLYFANIHPWLPFIQEQIFRRRLAQLQHAPLAETALLFLTVSLVMTGGTGSNGHDDFQSQLYYLCRYLFSFFQSVRPSSVELVQAGLLLVVYELGSARFQAASLNIGTCARLGYVLKLNIDLEESQDYSSWAEAEERRRVWLGIYMLDW